MSLVSPKAWVIGGDSGVLLGVAVGCWAHAVKQIAMNIANVRLKGVITLIRAQARIVGNWCVAILLCVSGRLYNTDSTIYSFVPAG